MRRLVTTLVLLTTTCGRPTADDEDAAAPPSDMGQAAESEAESDGSEGCREGLVECGGRCVDLQTDDTHCGECGHVCQEPEVFGHCEAGACPSALVCTARNTSLETCDEVCAEIGQRCDDEPDGYRRGCAGERYMVWSTASYDAALADCEARVNLYETSGKCERKIGWQTFIDDNPFSEAVACCCTQEPAP